MFSAILLIGACYGIYIVTKSVNACYTAEAYKAMKEMIYMIIFLMVVIVYLYLTREQEIITIILWVIQKDKSVKYLAVAVAGMFQDTEWILENYQREQIC